MKHPITTPRCDRALLLSVLLVGLTASPARSQTAAQREDSGEVVSSTRTTLVVRGENDQYQLFVFDRYTAKPDALAVGSRVRVVSIPAEEPNVRLARQITTLEASAATPQRPDAQPPPPVPPEIRRLERDIERQVRRYQFGARTGVALDPELVLVGVHAQMGPFFSPDVFFRPNVEFAYGEVTTLFAVNLEGIYRLPISSRAGRWSSYVGIGPAFTFLHQNFERETGDERDIDFGDFNSDIGLNILGGMRFRSGMFVELKASIYSRPAPTLRLILGYNF